MDIDLKESGWLDNGHTTETLSENSHVFVFLRAFIVFILGQHFRHVRKSNPSLQKLKLCFGKRKEKGYSQKLMECVVTKKNSRLNMTTGSEFFLTHDVDGISIQICFKTDISIDLYF